MQQVKGKSSIARVWILKGDGKITINGKKYNEYFKRSVHQLVIEKPFDITKTKNNYDIFATVKWWWYERSGRCNYTWYF